MQILSSSQIQQSDNHSIRQPFDVSQEAKE